MKMMHKNPAFARAQRGFTIVEALVTFLILSVGLLGMAGLQTKGLQMDQNAYQRSQAAMLGQDIADRMRVNTTSARTAAYDISLGDDAQTGTNCVTGACSAAAMAEFDLFQWKTSLAALLPAGDGKIETAVSVTAAPAVDATITIFWDEFRKGATGTNCPPINEDDMSCYQFNITL
jgi:type IV pilus assembly protein PilV